MKEEALKRLSGLFFTSTRGRCWICPSSQDFCVPGEEEIEEEPTVVKEDWHMTLNEAQKADTIALGQYVGELKAQKLGAEVDAERRTGRKAEPLMHLWSTTKKLEKLLDFVVAYKKGLM